MTTVHLYIPFESLAQAIASLNLDDKRKLCAMLEAQISEAEDELLDAELDSSAKEIEMKTYDASDYPTIEEYIASRSRQIS